MQRVMRLALLASILAASVTLAPAYAQTYSFRLDKETVDAYWEADGSLRLDYVFTFANELGADPIDAVDIGMPTADYSLSGVSASVDGHPVTDISSSPYATNGIALGLGSNAIRPGARGVVTATIPGVRGVLFQGSDANTVSVNFSPTWFDSQFVHGTTDLTVTFHLPPGVKPEEPRYFNPPSGWPPQPGTGFDADGRVIYTWRNPTANGYTQYAFGASFPKTYVPAGAITNPSLTQQLGLSSDAIFGLVCIGGVVLLFGLIITLAVVAGQRRKQAYLPPKIAIEGHGIKRGLTAVEAAVLLETPLDRVLTMLLFAVIKKNAARVVSEKPLKVEAITPAPEGLRDYEVAYMTAIVETDVASRSRKLQAVVIDLVKAVQQNMKGFSLRESRDYYKAIMQKAWQEVEQANTPEVKSERFSESLEWTMLDRDFDNRTQRTFRTGPVFVPIWWGNFRPSYGGTGHVSAAPARPSAGVPTASAPSLPHLPGSDFAASLVRGVQSTAGNMVTSVAAFTGGVTKTTNPPPPPTAYRGGGGFSGGGHSCACACACAGCACACAGGGR